MKYRTLYFKDNRLRMLNQTLLPTKIEYIECRSHYDVYDAIKNMKVRGAPAIGIAAAYGVVLAVENLVKPNGGDPTNWNETITELTRAILHLNSARPTAINLKWATARMLRFAQSAIKSRSFDLDVLRKFLLDEANRIFDEDVASCNKIGQFGSALIKDGMQVLTHCNAGALATAELGTALAPLYIAHRGGKKFNVYVDETRPLLQGARLTSWELQQSGLEPTLICDNMAATIMHAGKVDMVIVGADRIAKNGDVVNKIGTYGLAILASFHEIPFYVAAPLSTFDLNMATGYNVPIEIRHPNEVNKIQDVELAPPDVAVYNPAFDVTPAELIAGIITDHGIIQPVDEDHIERCFAY